MQEGAPMLTAMGLSLCLVAGSALGPPAVREWVEPARVSADTVAMMPVDSATIATGDAGLTDDAAPPTALNAQRSGFTGGGESFALSVALFASPSLFILLDQDEGQWVGGSTLFLAAICGLSPGRDEDDPPWPIASRLTFLGGMGGLAAYEIAHNDEFTDGELFWTHLAGVTATLFVTDFLFKRAR